MASVYEVIQVAGRVKNAYDEIDRKRLKASAVAQDSQHWWHGKSSEVFSQEYKKINGDIHSLLDVFVELEKQLKALAEAIAGAEAAALAVQTATGTKDAGDIIKSSGGKE